MTTKLVNWFSTLEEDVQESLSSRMSIEDFRSGQLLYRQNDPAGFFYRILRGRVRLSTLNSDGKELLVALCGPGHCIGVMSVIDGLPRSTHAEAEVDTQVGRLSSGDFSELAARHASIYHALLVSYTHWLRRNSLGHTSFRTIEERMASRLVFLLELSLAETQRVETLPIELQLTQEGLASAMGATRQAISRHLKQWRSVGIIDYRHGTLVVNDVAALRAIANDTADAVLGRHVGD